MGVVVSATTWTRPSWSPLRIASHPLYKKIFKRTKKFKAHDENNEAGVGDTVQIMETRRCPRTERWRVVKIVEKANIICHAAFVRGGS